MYGGFVPFKTCTYIANWARSAGSSDRKLLIERVSIKVEYINSLNRKNTEKVTDFSNTLDYPNPGFEEFSCGVTKISYHPGIKALFYFQTQNSKIMTIFQDNGYTGSDPCKKGEELFKDTTKVEKIQIDIGAKIYSNLDSNTYDQSTINILVDNTVFLQETMFIPVNVLKKSDSKTYTKIYRVSFTKDATGKVNGASVAMTYSSSKVLDQIKVFELVGFVYVKSGLTGYFLLRMNFDSNGYPTTK